jgi:putative glutamine amidotransferase
MGSFQPQDAQKAEGYQRLYVSNAYIVSVINSGGVPVVLPLTGNQEVIEEAIQSVNGLLVTGGVDLNPLLYGEEPSPKLGHFCELRDRTDICAINAATRCHKPILGICRGMQVINVAFGGTLYQDISLKEGMQFKHFQESEPYSAGHTVAIFKESCLYEILGSTIETNSFHHQAANRIAEGFIAGAVTKDGVPEEIEKISGDFVVGIQWHPEMMAANGDKTMQSIFNLFIKACMNGYDCESVTEPLVMDTKR